MKNFVEQIISAGKFLAARGWAPATGGNYSMRLPSGEIAITMSGKWKGELTEADIMTVDMDAKPTSSGTASKPSDETELHTTVYKIFPDVGAILHTHSIALTALTMALPDANEIVLEGYELQKAYPGITTHQCRVRLPIFANDQVMAPIARQIESVFGNPEGIAPVFLLRGHGLYGWASDMNGAKKLVEATEFMLSCELERLKIRQQSGG